MRAFVIVLLLLLCGTATPAFAQSSPFGEDFHKIRRDPPPEQLTQGHSYLTSDESELYLFKNVVTPRGGLYVGLGTDPNYVFAAWANADAMILMDFDQNVVDLHRVYGAFFRVAKTPAEFLALWDKDNEAAAHTAIEAAEPKRAKWLKRIYAQGRKKVKARLEWMRDTWPPLGAQTFASDQTQYDYCVKMVVEDRVHAVRGDLTKDKTMSDIAKFARKHGLQISTLYLTNAEYYFEFATGDYIKNITGLPMPDDSIVLHTFPRSQKEYRYVYEPGPVYQAWVKSEKVKDLRELIQRRAKKVEGTEWLFTIRKWPNGKDVLPASPQPPASAQDTK